MADYTTIDDSSAQFQVDLYTGTGSSLANTFDGNSAMQPDFVWIKERNGAADHSLWDSTRGVQKMLESNTTAAESTESTGLTAFGSDGFTVGALAQANTSSDTYVAWGWKANGSTTSTCTDGDINSTVQVNATAGFSIVTWTPTDTTARSIGHGLGVQPQVVIIRNRTRIENWRVFHRGAGVTGALILDDTTAYNSSTGLFTADSTSTVFKVGTDFSVNGGYPYVAYCFADIQGFSKFGSYLGDGDADGTFVYTGFKPAMVILKRTDTTNNWLIYDHKRSGYNPKQDKLYPDDTSAEDASTTSVDLLSNGFKLRADSASQNASDGTYIYMAWAEQPFVSSTNTNNIPTTAR